MRSPAASMSAICSRGPLRQVVALEQQLGVRERRRQRVAQLVRNRCGQCAALLLGAMEGRDVLHDQDGAAHPVVCRQGPRGHREHMPIALGIVEPDALAVGELAPRRASDRAVRRREGLPALRVVLDRSAGEGEVVRIEGVQLSIGLIDGENLTVRTDACHGDVEAVEHLRRAGGLLLSCGRGSGGGDRHDAKADCAVLGHCGPRCRCIPRGKTGSG